MHGRILLRPDRGRPSFRSVSDSPDDDLPLGQQHIVWGDEAKPPVFRTLADGFAVKLKSGASDASQRMIASHFNVFGIAVAMMVAGYFLFAPGE
jgi:hypothetical protein